VRTMTDFESRVRETLKAGSEGAPPPVGLAEGARQRWRKRRRTTAAVAATAVVLAAVPVGIAVLGDEGSPARKDGNVTASGLPEIPSGWRWESWRNVQIAVPGSWEPGAASQWCVGDAPAAGTVDRGEGFSTLVACSPGLSSSVSFREGIAKHPLVDIKGVGRRLTFDGSTVDVVAPDQETLDAIVASANEIVDTDSRGCAPAIQDLTESPSADASGPLTVCRYVTLPGNSDAYQLAESRDLDDEESSGWLAALDAAPAVSESGNACDYDGGAEAMLVSSDDGLVAFIEADPCGGGFVQTGDGEKAVSSDLLAPLGSQLGFPG
jgi:hypothetical protein